LKHRLLDAADPTIFDAPPRLPQRVYIGIARLFSVTREEPVIRKAAEDFECASSK
jgi:hypothetical protein